MKSITPFLWFNGQAEEAARFYTSIFPDSRIVSVSRYGEAGPGPKGSVMTTNFVLNGQEFVALNGGPEFMFSPAISFVVSCDTQQEVDQFWNALTADGGKPNQCGWLQDKYGLSWQVVPTALGRLLQHPDPRKSQAVMAAMLRMTKIDIAQLEAAAA